MQKSVYYPLNVRHGIKPNHRAFPIDSSLRLFGCDTETVLGKIHTFQVYDGTGETYLEYVTPETALKQFLAYILPRCKAGGVNIAYFHNLKYDLPQLFSKQQRMMFDQFNAIRFEVEGAKISMLFGKVNTCTIKKFGVKLTLLDSFAFTTASLKRSLKMFGVAEGKLEFKEEWALKKSYEKEFEEYAKQDAKAEYFLGQKILGFHKAYKVRPSISLPQFAGRVFRHYYFKPDTLIRFPPIEIVKAAELSYHGGKNGKPDPEPRRYDFLREADVNSAYPYGMSLLPQFVKGDYIKTREFIPGYAGIYCLSGRVKGGRYPWIFKHDFSPVNRGAFRDIWTGSYEVEDILTRYQDDVEITGLWGYIWAPGDYPHNCFKEYVDHFYALKEKTPKADPMYIIYKLMLNGGPYGKLLAAIEERDAEEEGRGEAGYIYNPDSGSFKRQKRKFRAGSMYNPFIGTLITSKARQVLGRLETKYHAVHSATDAIKTEMDIQASPGLGGWKIEVEGICYLFRNKLYLHFAQDFTLCGHKPGEVEFWENGQHLCKVGLHGFKGPLKLIFEKRQQLLESHHLNYKYKHAVGLREGIKRQETVGLFVMRDDVLCLCQGPHDRKLCESKRLRCHCVKKSLDRSGSLGLESQRNQSLTRV